MAERDIPSGTRRIPLFLLCALFLMGVSGCGYLTSTVAQVSIAPVVPPRGYLYFHYTAPLVLPKPMDLTNVNGKSGKELVYIKLPYVNTDFAVGHADIEHAMRIAGVKTLVYADYEYTNLLGFFKTLTINAYGYRE